MKKIFFLILCLAVLLASPSWAAANDVSPNGERLFRVYVFDGDVCVEDAVIQFCDDTVCQIGKTDADGLAAFEAPDGKRYEIHVLKVPGGYEINREIFKTLDVYSDVRIPLQKSK